MAEILPTHVQEVFAHIPISDLVEHQKLIYANPTDSLESIWKKLTREAIHSLPILKEDLTLVGIVDALDLLAFALEVMPYDDTVREKKRARFTMALEEVERILDKSGRDPCAPVEIDNHVNYLVDLFASGIHRVPLTNKDGKVTNLVSQSDVIRLFHAECKKGKLQHLNILETPLPQTGLGSQRTTGLSLVKQDSPLKEVMQLMLTKGITGLGVVDAQGNFVGNFSAQDLAGIYRETLPDFEISVIQFLEKHSPKSLSTSQLLRSDCLLGEIVDVMVHKHYHRVWLVDQNKPTGVVTMTDLVIFMRDYEKLTKQ